MTTTPEPDGVDADYPYGPPPPYAGYTGADGHLVPPSGEAPGPREGDAGVDADGGEHVYQAGGWEPVTEAEAGG